MNALSPFQYEFMLQAFGIGALVAVVCASFSCFLVLKGWALMGDAISHAVLPGIVIAYVVGAPLVIGAFISGLFCATATGFIKHHSRLKEDTAMGVVFTGLFALGLVLFTKIDSDQHLTHILFGSLLGIPATVALQTVAIAVLTLLTILCCRKDLFLYCFDSQHAQGIGLNPSLLHYLMLALLSLTIVASLQAVGIILVIAMLVTPGCTGRMLSKSFGRMLLIATSTAVASSFIGIYFSFFLDASTGACIVLVQAAIFAAAALIARHDRGLV